MKRAIFLGVIGLSLLFTPIAHAQTPPNENKGLLITPLREQVNLNAGMSRTLILTVANRTNDPLNIQLFDKQFSVANYTYDYKFHIPQPDLVTIGKPQVQLKPGESQKIPYTIAVPKNASPGGQYYTLFASATLANESTTIQAASLLYVTVNGDLRKTTELQSASIQRIAFGNKISYKLAAKNTGNVHYFVYVSGELSGPSAKPAEPPTTHLLMPNTVRNLDGAISSPVLPGFYQATYGYKTDSGQETLRTSYVFYIPPWSIAFLLLLVLAVWHLVSHRKKHQKKPAPPATDES
ncbi:hypothetical protein EYC59_03735 [Candidatus Saccharibacteria bacterium]|nr:MAG: hypothetical protein EYC59_03735 [Candidatus Saccharibacteria bacterium]